MSEEIKDLIPLEAHDKIKDVFSFLNSIVEIKIDSEDQYKKAGEHLVDIKRSYNELEVMRKEVVKPLNDKVSGVNGYFKEYTEKLVKAEQTFKNGRLVWFTEQERKRIEEQKKLEAEAAEERRKAEEKAEAERIKAEAYREKGREDLADKAEARAETAETIAVNTVAQVVEKIDTGKSSMREVYKVEIQDQKSALMAIANNAALSCFLKIDIAGLEKFANVTKGNLVIDGVRVYKTFIESVRTK
jgi:hypothetical protein